MGTLTGVRALYKAHLESFSDFDDAVILEGKPKDLGFQIDEGLAKLGIVIVIAVTKAGTTRNDLPGPVLDDAELIASVFHNPLLQEDIEALDIAEAIAKRSQLVVLDEENQVKLRCQRDTISLSDDVGNEENPCVNWDVPIQFTCFLHADWDIVATPTVVFDGTTVQMRCDTPGAAIFYTTNGKRPNAKTGTLYTGTVTIDDPTTIKARAWLWGSLPSDTATATEGEIMPDITLAQIKAALELGGGSFQLTAAGDPVIKGQDDQYHDVQVSTPGDSVVAGDGRATIDAP